MPNEQTPAPPTASVASKKSSRFSIVWIVPIIAALAGAWVTITRIESEGPKITIVFQSADGLEAGKTKIQYKGVEVGTVTNVRLSDDHKQIIAMAQMAPKTEDFLVEDTAFWVVRPRVSGANVTGLGTLISGAYIGIQIGKTHEPRREFTGLETPPIIGGDVPGHYFVLKTPDLGSLDLGTPVFFRRLQVGEIAAYSLDSNGQLFTVKVFIKSPYDQYVKDNSRFWQASGIDMQLSANGLSLRTQSVLSILIGGIAFETPSSDATVAAPAADRVFTLYSTRNEAFEPPPLNPQSFTLVFDESVRGLAVGAPVELRGIKVGEVADIQAQIDVTNYRFSVPVTIHLDARRFGLKLTNLTEAANLAAMRRQTIDSMVAHGLRAQLRMGNLPTGSAFIAFDFFPGAPKATTDWSQNPPQLPTLPGQLEQTEASIANIIKKIDKMPLQQIGENLQKSLHDLDQTLISTRGTLDTATVTLKNAGDVVGPNSEQLQQLNSTLDEVRRAARSVRVLTDYLEQHPESLIRGKKGKPQ